jgi:hypothetical protein
VPSLYTTIGAISSYRLGMPSPTSISRRATSRGLIAADVATDLRRRGHGGHGRLARRCGPVALTGAMTARVREEVLAGSSGSPGRRRVRPVARAAAGSDQDFRENACSV